MLAAIIFAIIGVVFLFGAVLDGFGVAWGAIACGLAFAYFEFGGAVTSFITTHPYELIGGIVGWFAIGAAWSVFMWTRLNIVLLDKWNEYCALANQMKAKPSKSEFLRSIKNKVHSWRPRASEEKLRITSWIAYWPISMLLWVLKDPITRIVNWVFKKMTGVYGRISDHIYRNNPELKEDI